MFTPELVKVFQSQSAQMEDQSVLHFGSPDDEKNALATTAVVCPIQNWIRIRATGNDRAKFLHNFCTNDIKGLATGHCCEAIFTDVKAKVLAHTFVLAGDDCHEIWMRSEAQEGLLKHLNRYIIVEDVNIEAVGGDHTTFAVIGSQAIDVAAVPQATEVNLCQLSGDVAAMCREWNQQPIVVVSVSAESAVDNWKRLTAGMAIPSGEWLFDHQRICEGFPIFGQDISSDNLAPEAGRNAQAISYTKGCYLGQEPIARIDAMGHVNKQIFKCEATIAATDESAATMNLSSVSKIGTGSKPALTMLSVKSVESDDNIVAKTQDGQTYELKVLTTAT